METHVLEAEPREQRGTTAARRLRRSGVVPGNLYGHKQDPVAISANGDAVQNLLTSGARVVNLDIGGQTEMAMFRDVQWDTFGLELQHFDLVRIDKDDRVTVEVPIQTRGVAPGTMAGGVLETSLRTLTVECAAFAIPESIAVRVGKLEVGDAIHVRDLELPDGATAQNPPDATVVHVVKPVDTDEEATDADEAALAPAEPEVIGRKADDESSE